MTHPIRIWTTDGWVDLGTAGPVIQADLDAVPWRGYAFRMVSGEAAVGPGSFIRAAQQNNNSYDDADYFQGWKAGNATAIVVMKAGFVKICATIYLTGLTASSTAEAGIYLNGAQLHGTRIIPAGTSSSIMVGPIIRNCIVGDQIQFGAVSPAGALAYQGTDGRYTTGWLEYLGA